MSLERERNSVLSLLIDGDESDLLARIDATVAKLAGPSQFAIFLLGAASLVSMLKTLEIRFTAYANENLTMEECRELVMIVHKARLENDARIAEMARLANSEPGGSA